MGDPPRQRRQILSEEEYTATLESIVQRDYFPEIPQLERQSALLERRAQGDVAGAIAVRRATSRLQRHEQALSALEQQAEHDLTSSNTRKRARPLHQETISGFHGRATNEDDEEFHLQQKEQVAAQRQYLEDLFRKDDKQVIPLLTMASDQFAPESNRIAAVDWKKPSVRNGLFMPPTPLRTQTQTTTKLLTAETNTAESSSSMPPPQKASTRLLIEYVPKHMLERKIQPENTRFQTASVSLPIVPRTYAESDTDGSVTDASTDLDAPLRPIEYERERRQKREQRTERSHVAMTPLIVPGGSGNDSPLMTWGSVDSTPLVLSGQEETSAPAFSLSTENSRDDAARRAEDIVQKRIARAHSKRRISSSKSRSSSSTPSRASNSFASALRTSYTPQRRSGSRSRPSTDTAYRATPKRLPSSSSK